MTDIYIHATGDYYARCDETISVDLKQLVAEAIGQPVRRIGRFIQLALVGAGRCAKAANLDNNAAVYLGSGRGDLEITIEVMQALLRDGHAPKPLSFINTVSNAACYYIAQNLKLMGRSSFVCNRYFAFETVLQLAALDLRTGAVSAALIGAVDVVVPPLNQHRTRLGLATDAAVADASHWLCLRSTSEGAIGRLLAAENFADRGTLDTWLQSQTLSACLLSGGQFLTNDELQPLAQQASLNDRFEYRNDRAYYDCQSGAAISKFLSDTSLAGRQLLHINRDPSGRYGIMWIENPSPTAH
jgi:hypothetical protein